MDNSVETVYYGQSQKPFIYWTFLVLYEKWCKNLLFLISRETYYGYTWNMKYSISRQFGNIGEKLACQFLMKRGFKIVAQNYLKPWGEIDIVTTRDRVYHFIEVKTVKVTLGEVTQETFRPEENVHPKKLERMYRTIETYIAERGIDADWQIDVVTVKIDQEQKRAQIEIIENIVG